MVGLSLFSYATHTNPRQLMQNYENILATGEETCHAFLGNRTLKYNVIIWPKTVLHICPVSYGATRPVDDSMNIVLHQSGRHSCRSDCVDVYDDPELRGPGVTLGPVSRDASNTYIL